MHARTLIDELELRRDVLNRERYYSHFQPLADLGYLSYDALKEESSQEVREGAVRAFRRDYQREGLLSLRVNYESVDTYHEYAYMLNMAEERLLHQLVSLDGTFSFAALPKMESGGVTPRVARFRLKLLGLYREGDELSSALEKLCERMGQTEHTMLDLLNMTGNLDLLMHHYLCSSVGDSAKRIACVLLPGENPGEEVLKMMHTPQNDFVARLYQLFLWKNGFYEGRIDGDMGKMSRTSLRDFMVMINGRRERDPIHWRTLIKRKVGSPYESWDIGTLMGAYLKWKAEFSQNTSSERSRQEMELPDDFPLELSVRRLLREVSFNWAHRRQAYFGNVTHLAMPEVALLEERFEQPLLLQEGYKRGRKWLKRWYAKATGILRSTFRKLIQRLRKGLALFLHGLRFLLGDRMLVTKGENGLLVSQYEGDFDAYLWGNIGGDQRSFRRHVKKTAYLSHSLAYSLGLVGRVIRLLWLVSGPVGWFRLARIAADALSHYDGSI